MPAFRSANNSYSEFLKHPPKSKETSFKVKRWHSTDEMNLTLQCLMWPCSKSWSENFGTEKCRTIVVVHWFETWAEWIFLAGPNSWLFMSIKPDMINQSRQRITESLNYPNQITFRQLEPRVDTVCTRSRQYKNNN